MANKTPPARIRKYILFLILIFPLISNAKRLPPTPVEPLVYQGIQYSAYYDQDRFACIKATKLKSGKLLWVKRIFNMFSYPPNDLKHKPPIIAPDTQVYITTIKILGDTIKITDELNNTYSLDLAT